MDHANQRHHFDITHSNLNLNVQAELPTLCTSAGQEAAPLGEAQSDTSDTSPRVQAQALQTCREEVVTGSNTDAQQDPFGAQTVYVPVPCNESSAGQGSSLVRSESSSLLDMEEKLEQLQKSLSRKDELLRVRNNQLVEAYQTLENRAALWNESLIRVDERAAVTPDLLAVVAVVSDYGQIELRRQFRKAWQAGGDSQWLQDTLGMRMVFVVGRNPYMVSDGTGVAHDTDAIKAELEVNDDIVRVEAVHKDGTDGRSELMHDVWRVLPRKFHAHFYAKAQVSSLPSPIGFAEVLTQYDARDPIYAGCMKSGEVVTDWKSPWYEPQNHKFGYNNGGRNYMLHAAATGYVMSRPVALHVSRFAGALATYSNEDVMVGAWMIGLNVEHQYEQGLCCSAPDECQFSPGSLSAASGAAHDYLKRGGVPVDSGAGRRRRLAGKGEDRCAIHTGTCNGVCGVDCAKGCDIDPSWQKFRECVRTG